MMEINLTVNSDQLKQLLVALKMNIENSEKTIAIIERDDPDNVILNSFHEDLERRKGLLSILECEWNKYLGNNCRMQED